MSMAQVVYMFVLDSVRGCLNMDTQYTLGVSIQGRGLSNIIPKGARWGPIFRGQYGAPAIVCKGSVASVSKRRALEGYMSGFRICSSSR